MPSASFLRHELLRPVRIHAARVVARVAPRLQPPRPPLDTPERVRRFSLTPRSRRFITGNGFASACRYVLNYDALKVNESVENDWWFCKVDFLEYFFRRVAPRSPFVLFTHNGDRLIDARLRRYLDRRELVAWFAANAALAHPKLHAIPLGIANPVWPHGDGRQLEAVQRERILKERLFHVRFDVETNPEERRKCLAETGLELEQPTVFRDYLQRLASSYFCIAPQGNGIDTHRIWEALYVRTVPVVTRSVLIDQHPDLPIVVLDDWADFASIDFSPALYEHVWGDWDPKEISLDRYVERVQAIIGR